MAEKLVASGKSGKFAAGVERAEYLKKVECAGKRLAGYTHVNSNITTV